jgi:hypothetical protein
MAGEEESAAGSEAAAARRRSLAELLRREDRGAVGDGGPVFPDAYVRSQRPGPVDYLPDVRRWLALLAAGAVLLALVSIPVWRAATDGVPALVRQLLGLLG